MIEVIIGEEPIASYRTVLVDIVQGSLDEFLRERVLMLEEVCFMIVVESCTEVTLEVVGEAESCVGGGVLWVDCEAFLIEHNGAFKVSKVL